MVQFSSNEDPAKSLAPARLSGREPRGTVSGEKIRTFTRESANQILPLVGRIAQDLITLWQDLEIEAAQIRGIKSLPRSSDIRVFTEELDCVKEAFRVQSERLSEIQKELSALGVVIDSPHDCAFDFPAYDQARPIRLCWKLGEPEVTHWHGINESFCDRRTLSEL